MKILDMDEQFTHIATILFEHNYFTNGVFESAEISTQTETLSILQNLNVLVKPFKGGSHLLTSQVEGLKTVFKDVRFEMRSSDPYFINYTSLPQFRSSRDICYFTKDTFNSFENIAIINKLQQEDFTFIGTNEKI